MLATTVPAITVLAIAVLAITVLVTTVLAIVQVTAFAYPGAVDGPGLVRLVRQGKGEA